MIISTNYASIWLLLISITGKLVEKQKMTNDYNPD